MRDLTGAVDLIEASNRIRSACDAAGSQKRWAEANNIRAQAVREVTCGLALPSTAMLRAVGLKAVTVYVPVKVSA